MKLTKDQAKHVATLARIKLTESELEKFRTQISGILDYVEILNEVNTDNVSATAQITGLTNVTRPDLWRDSGGNSSIARPEDLLNCSPLSIENNQIKVKNVF